jgi:hypothetical protein
LVVLETVCKRMKQNVVDVSGRLVNRRNDLMIKCRVNSICLFLMIYCVNFAYGNDDALLQEIKAGVLAGRICWMR